MTTMTTADAIRALDEHLGEDVEIHTYISRFSDDEDAGGLTVRLRMFVNGKLHRHRIPGAYRIGRRVYPTLFDVSRAEIEPLIITHGEERKAYDAAIWEQRYGSQATAHGSVLSTFEQQPALCWVDGAWAVYHCGLIGLRFKLIDEPLVAGTIIWGPTSPVWDMEAYKREQNDKQQRTTPMPVPKKAKVKKPKMPPQPKRPAAPKKPKMPPQIKTKRRK